MGESGRFSTDTSQDNSKTEAMSDEEEENPMAEMLRLMRKADANREEDRRERLEDQEERRRGLGDLKRTVLGEVAAIKTRQDDLRRRTDDLERRMNKLEGKRALPGEPSLLEAATAPAIPQAELNSLTSSLAAHPSLAKGPLLQLHALLEDHLCPVPCHLLCILVRLLQGVPSDGD